VIKDPAGKVWADGKERSTLLEDSARCGAGGAVSTSRGSRVWFGERIRFCHFGDLRSLLLIGST